MTWGIYETSSFGAYMPDGEYVGWDEALEQYYIEVMTDEERAEYGIHKFRSYANSVTRKFTHEPGFTIDGLPPLGPVLDHEVPKEFKLYRKPAKDLSAMIHLGVHAVSEELKAAIEALEPGVHEFWPIRLTLPGGDAWPVQYYTMRIGRFLDSFRPDESDEGSWEKRGIKVDRYLVEIPDKKHFAGLGMSQAEIGGAHLWREKHLYLPQICMSDEMQAAMKAAGFKGSKLYRMKDVP